MPAVLSLALGAEPAGAPAAGHLSCLDNGEIRVGVDPDLGGAITWLSAGTRGNLINNFDWGRQIQLSFYSGPRPFEPGGRKSHPAWKSWAWNPIQSGDVYRNRSQVVELTNTGTEIRLVCIPLQWALNDVPGDCRYEARITLEGPMVRVRYRLVNAREDRTWYGGFRQELPAIYTIGALHRLLTYSGEEPFTGAPLTRVENDWKQKFPWARFLATEGWVAAVGDDDWGVGICNPEIYHCLGGTYGDERSADPKASSTTYLSPVSTEVLDHDIVFGFELLARVGSLPDLRRYFTGIMAPRALPRWEFAHDRQHWVPLDGADAGWPVSDRLVLASGPGKRARIAGPTYPFSAARARKMRITGTWKGLTGTGQVVWNRQRGNQPAEPGRIAFPLPPDGVEAAVDVDFSASPAWSGLITQFTLELADQPAAGGQVELRAIEVLPSQP